MLGILFLAPNSFIRSTAARAADKLAATLSFANGTGRNIPRSVSVLTHLMLKEPVFKGLVSGVAASPFKEQLVLLQEDITGGCTQTPKASKLSSIWGPCASDTPATTSGQQRHRKVKTLPCAYIHWQGDAVKAALHTHRLKASPRRAEKAFISSVSLSSQRFYPFSEMYSSQSYIVAFTLQEDAKGTDPSMYRLESLGQTSVPANTSAGCFSNGTQNSLTPNRSPVMHKNSLWNPDSSKCVLPSQCFPCD